MPETLTLDQMNARIRASGGFEHVLRRAESFEPEGLIFLTPRHGEAQADFAHKTTAKSVGAGFRLLWCVRSSVADGAPVGSPCQDALSRLHRGCDVSVERTEGQAR
jgi:hypothetical protein